MDIFISWSGNQSKKIAEVIRNWIPCVIQAAKPYYTPDDISKGQRWSSEIASKLEASQIGLIVLTPENISAPWIMFEAGALSKNVGSSSVCPLLFGVSQTDIQGPLLQFQCSQFSKDEFLKLIQVINQKLDQGHLDDETLKTSFNMWWPKLEDQISSIQTTHEEASNLKNPASTRTDRDILEEILRLSRRTNFSHARTPRENSSIFDPLRKAVTFDYDTGVISFWIDRQEVYDFSIDRLSSGSEILDWFFQINSKQWSTPQHLKEFLDCIEEITSLYLQKNAQGVFCPFGDNQHVDWKNILKHNIPKN